MTTHRIGIIGAGQLARMSLAPATALGVGVCLLAEGFDDAAAATWPDVLLGSPDSAAAIEALASMCDVTTFDHELVNTDVIRALEDRGLRFAPSASVMAISQSKIAQRQCFLQRKIPIPRFSIVDMVLPQHGMHAAADDLGWPLVIKSDRGGYDGRGVWIAEDRSAARYLATRLHSQGISAIFEERVSIDHEVAIITARTARGEVRTYPLVETIQIDGMLRELRAPARVDSAIAVEAKQIAERLGAELDVVGLLAVEFFVTGDRLLVNEIATRPHNSGHYTIEGSVTSQFEQHLRAILGLPLGDTQLTGCHVATVNVVGGADGSDPTSRLAAALAVTGGHIHLYGKAPRPKRKLGHVTVVSDDREEGLERARMAAQLLEGAIRHE